MRERRRRRQSAAASQPKSLKGCELWALSKSRVTPLVVSVKHETPTRWWGEVEMEQAVQNKDLTLLVIASAGESGLSPVQLQKSLFLLGKSKLPDIPQDFYPFYPYNYGPFHPNVYADADALSKEGLVMLAPSGQGWSTYIITSAGVTKAGEVRKKLQQVTASYIDQLVSWVKSHSFNALLRAIYAAYPDFRANSIFQG